MSLVVCLSVVAVLYAVVWLILFIFPCLIHPPKKNKIQAKLIAHRGGAGEHLENTMTAFRSAIANNMHMLELDCYLTRDGHVVVSHDAHLLSLTGEDVYIHDLNYKELPLLKPVLDVDFAKGQTCSGNPSDRKIPLLREVFRNFPDVPMNLDVGADDEVLIDKVMDMIKEFRREEITILGDFDENIVRKIHAKAPSSMLFFSERNFYWLVAAFYLGILPFVPLKESFLEIPVGSVLRHAGLENWLFFTFPQLYEALILNRFLMFHLHQRGIKVLVWVVNTEQQWEHAFACGADAVMTDYPSKLREYAKKKML